MVEQPGGRQEHIGPTHLIEVLQKEVGVLVSLFRRFIEIRPGLFSVLFDILAGEVQFSKSVLGVLVALLGGLGEICHRFWHVFRDIISFQIQLSQAVGGAGVLLRRRFFIPGYCLVHSVLTLQELPQRVLGEVISRVRRPPEPQFRLLVIGENASSVPPAFAQLVGGQRETSLPELFQHPHLFRFFTLRVFVLLQHLLGTLVGLGHLPVGVPGEVHRILVLIHLVPHTGILEGNRAQPEPLRLPDDHVLDGFELLLLGEGQVFSGGVLVVTLQLVPKLIPLFIALCHLRDLGQLIHDGVHLRLHRLFQVGAGIVAVGIGVSEADNVHF